MHKGIILLVKAISYDKAKLSAENFLEENKYRNWDWYQIGGRWTGLLDGYDPQKDPKNLEAGKPKWPTSWEEHKNNIMPLSECLEEVKKYKGDLDKQIAEEMTYYEKYKVRGNRKMAGYCLSCVAEIMLENFGFECNVYNTEEFDFSIPKDTRYFWAIVVDMHN